jgi:hypothetical protein
VLFCRLMLDNYDHQTACAELLRLTALLRTFNDVERRLGTGPAKGERGGRCNREACRTGQPATCRHRQTGRYYCPPCARQINEHNPPSGGAKPLVEIPRAAGPDSACHVPGRGAYYGTATGPPLLNPGLRAGRSFEMTPRKSKRTTERPRPVVEPMEARVLFSGNFISGVMAIIGVLDPKSAQSQPGGYDPKIGLLPFTQK